MSNSSEITENEGYAININIYRKLKECEAKIESSPEESIEVLRTLQQSVVSLRLFSTNETIEDVETSSIPFLGIEHHLALAFVACTSKSSVQRMKNVTHAMDLHFAFLRALDKMDALKSNIRQAYEELLEMNDIEDEDVPSSSLKNKRHIGESRETKIARFRATKEAKDKLAHLEALLERRKRVGVSPNEEIDGYDDDSIMRSIYIADLHRRCLVSIDEIHAAVREKEMLKMAVSMENEKNHIDQYRGNCNSESSQKSRHEALIENHQTRKPIEVTRIDQDLSTGSLIFKREHIKSQIFRPSWNQPTMTLQELADIEVAQAKERSEKQKIEEKEAKTRPRRYDQLLRDGMEDDADLVEQSSILDRRWDDFKDENPRGWGNKNGERGDRNF